MRKKLLINYLSFIPLTFLLISTAHASASSVRQDFKDTFEIVRKQFKTRYGLYEWKKTLFGWEIDKQINDLLSEGGVKSTGLDKTKAQLLVKSFFESARDYHAVAFTNDKTSKSLPIGIRSAEGKAFITFIDPTFYSGRITEGDEVLSFDGVPILDAISKMRSPRFTNYEALDVRMAENNLTSRFAMFLHTMPTSETAELVLRDKNGLTYPESLEWATSSLIKSVRVTKNIYKKIPLVLQGTMESNPQEVGSARGYFPKPSSILWEKQGTYFYSWATQLATGERVGYIRIPDFYPASDSAGFKSAVLEFEALIVRMNQETDSLVLDLLSNSGGVLDYGWALSSYFLSTPEETPRFQYRLFPELVESAKTLLPQLSAIHSDVEAQTFFGGDHYYGYPVNLSFAQDMLTFYQGIISDANTGAALGQPRAYNATFVKPNPRVQYLKPLFVLVDEYSISCGDIIPAFLQDSGRATILGRRTSGAGAFVGETITAKNALGLNSMRIPFALAYRKNGEKIENVGVKPDVEFPLLASDLKNGFRDFRDGVLNYVSAH